MEPNEKEESDKKEELKENKENKEINNETKNTEEKDEIKENKNEENSENKINRSKEMKTIEAPPSIGGNKIIFEDSEFYYTIGELESKDGIYIKLSEAKPEKNVYFIYEASNEKLIKEIDLFIIFQNTEQRINLLYKTFKDDKVKIIKKEEKYFLELEFVVSGLEKKYEIEIERIEIHEPTKEDLINSFKDLNEKFKELKDEINVIKKNTSKSFEESANLNSINPNINSDINLILDELEKKINIKEKIKEALKEKDIQDLLFSEFQKYFPNNKNPEIIQENNNININKNNLNSIENKKVDNDFENKILEKIKTSVDELINEKLKIKEEDEKNIKERLEKIEGDNFENKILEKIKASIDELVNEKLKIREENEKNIKESLEKTEGEIQNKINYINKIIENNKDNNNYITAKIVVNKDNIGKNIRILRQNKTYKNLYNFEYDDFVVFVDGESIPVTYNNINGSFSYNSSCDYTTQQNVYYLIASYEFCIKFDKEGEYTIKILFKKKLNSFYNLFYECSNIKEIDLSHFDCSEVKSCGYMFYGCTSLSKINFGNVDFNSSNYFGYMFYNCSELEELDVSGFITKKCNNFDYMFYGCKKLNNIDVSNFNSSNCNSIKYMYYQCENIKLIDMINWDMSNISDISYLFNGCKNLDKIKISSNFKNIENLTMSYVFDGIPKKGNFYHKKEYGIICRQLTKTLPENWDIDKE